MIRMHEMPIVLNISRTVQEFAEENKVNDVKVVVVEIGELTGVMPKYVDNLWPVAVEGTMLEKTALQLITVPGIARCLRCSTKYKAKDHNGICPACGYNRRAILSGKDVLVKEIQVI